MSNAIQTNKNFKGDHRSVKMFSGGQIFSSGNRVFDAATTLGSNIIFSINAKFTSGDLNKVAFCVGAGLNGTDIVSAITEFIDSSHVRIGTNVSLSLPATEFRYGFDNTVAFNAAVTYLTTTKKNGGRIWVPKGFYITTATINVGTNIRFEGECYTSVSIFGNGPTEPPSFICCVNPVPVFTIIGSPCYSPAFSKLGITGVSSAGSIGIYGQSVWDITVEHCFFDYFGYQAIFIDSIAPTFSVTATFNHNFIQNAMLVRSGWNKYTGVLDIASTDTFLHANNVTASFSQDVGQRVTGFISALALRGANGFIGTNEFSHSEVGVYVGVGAQQTTFVNTRADLNQGPALVVDQGVGQCEFIGFRSFANSLGYDGQFSAYVIGGGGHRFTSCKHSFNGVGFGALSARVGNVFETQNTNTDEVNQFIFCYAAPNSYTGSDFIQSGTQKTNTYLDSTGQDPLGRPTIRIRSDLSLRNFDFIHISNSTDNLLTANSKSWRQTLNYPGNGIAQYLFQIFNDAQTNGIPYLLVDRSGMQINFIRFLNAIVQILNGLAVTGNITITNGQIILQPTANLIASGAGSPDGLISAPGGSLFLDGSGHIFWKNTGTGAAGWKQLDIGLPLSILQGGTGATTALDTRVNLSLYSKAEVDAQILFLQQQINAKATAGVQTGTSSGHSHNQN